MIKIFLIALGSVLLIGCNTKESLNASAPEPLNEISALYTPAVSKMMYSASVQDSFRIFSSLPQSYSSDSTKYPLILLLDANAYFEPVVAELRLGTLTQGYPGSVVIGIGYKDFGTLDSLRDRDDTFPVAFPKDSFSVSGGGDRFKKFIDTELLPKLSDEYRIDEKNVTLIGHSLAGYFVLYHLFESASDQKFLIRNYIAASPSLVYHDFYLNDRLNELSKQSLQLPVTLYTSIGTLEYDPAPAENQFLIFKSRLDSFSQHTNTSIKAEEYSNFNHMEAAMPGFMKGLVFAIVDR